MPTAARPARARSLPATLRRPTNVTLPDELLEQARTLGVNVSKACETGLAAAVKQQRAAAWLIENRAALDAWNDYVEENGLPLAQFRQF